MYAWKPLLQRIPLHNSLPTGGRSRDTENIQRSTGLGARAGRMPGLGPKWEGTCVTAERLHIRCAAPAPLCSYRLGLNRCGLQARTNDGFASDLAAHGPGRGAMFVCWGLAV